MNLTMAAPNHNKRLLLLALVSLALFCGLAVSVRAIQSASFILPAHTVSAPGNQAGALSSQPGPGILPIPEPPSDAIANSSVPRATAAPLNAQPKPVPQPVPTPDFQK